MLQGLKAPTRNESMSPYRPQRDYFRWRGEANPICYFTQASIITRTNPYILQGINNYLLLTRICLEIQWVCI